MNWVLETSSKRIGIKTVRVIGREDFPANENLSRKHFEIAVNDEICLVKDLESHNGTFINGARLKPNKAYKLEAEDVLRAGELEFSCQPGEMGLPALKTIFISCTLITAVLYAALINGQGMDHGRGIGLWNDFTLFTILAFSVMALSLAFRVLARAEYWSAKVSALHFTVVLFGSIFVNDALLNVANTQILLGDNMAEAKIEYYCSAHFNVRKCINEIALCPPCAHRLKKDERQAILKRIDPFRHEVASYVATQSQRKPAATESILPTH